MGRHRDISWQCIYHRVLVALCKRPLPPLPGQGCAESFLPPTRNASLHPVPPLLMCWDLPSALGFGLGSHLQMVPSLLWFGQIEWVCEHSFGHRATVKGGSHVSKVCFYQDNYNGLLWTAHHLLSLRIGPQAFISAGGHGRSHSKCEITGLRPVRLEFIQPSSQELSFADTWTAQRPNHWPKTTLPQIVQRLHAWNRYP